MEIQTRSIPVDLNREYTVEEFELLEDDGNRYELIEGKLVYMPPTGDDHGRIIDVLYRQLVRFDPDLKLGRAWITTGFNIGKKPNGKDNVPEPDLGFIVADRIPPRSKTWLPVPDLIVEVWSPESDLGSKSKLKKARDKIRLFLQAGVKIGWGINPDMQEVEVYHQGQTEPVKVLKGEDELDGEDIIPGFKLKVSKLFE